MLICAIISSVIYLSVIGNIFQKYQDVSIRSLYVSTSIVEKKNYICIHGLHH